MPLLFWVFQKILVKLNGGLKKSSKFFISLSPSLMLQNVALNLLMWVNYVRSTFHLVKYLFGLSPWSEPLICVGLYFSMIVKLSPKTKILKKAAVIKHLISFSKNFSYWNGVYTYVYHGFLENLILKVLPECNKSLSWSFFHLQKVVSCFYCEGSERTIQLL